MAECSVLLLLSHTLSDCMSSLTCVANGMKCSSLLQAADQAPRTNPARCAVCSQMSCCKHRRCTSSGLFGSPVHSATSRTHWRYGLLKSPSYNVVAAVQHMRVRSARRSSACNQARFDSKKVGRDAFGPSKASHQPCLMARLKRLTA